MIQKTVSIRQPRPQSSALNFQSNPLNRSSIALDDLLCFCLSTGADEAYDCKPAMGIPAFGRGNWVSLLASIAPSRPAPRLSSPVMIPNARIGLAPTSVGLLEVVLFKDSPISSDRFNEKVFLLSTNSSVGPTLLSARLLRGATRLRILDNSAISVRPSVENWLSWIS